MMSFVSACSVFSPVKIATPEKYLLKEVPYVEKHQTHPITIAIAPVKGEPLYDRMEMAYATSPYSIDYFTKSEWAESPSKMVQVLLEKSLNNSHYFHGVITLPSYARYHYLLNTEIIDLKQLFVTNGSYYQIKVKVDLIDARNARLIASKTFTTKRSAHENNARGGVIAANHAMADVLRKITRFCIQHLN